MAKISELTHGNPAQNTDLIPVARGASDVSLTVADIAAAAPVQSVAGRSGAVVLAESDVTNLTADLAAKATAANLTAETARATAAESANATAITTETTRAQAAEALLVPKTTTVNGHALSAPVVVSASDLTTGTLPHAQLPALLVADIPALPESGITNLTTDLAAKEVTANKDTDVTLTANSDTKYPSQKAIKAYVDAKARLGFDAAKYGVTGNGYFKFDVVGYFLALSQAAIAGNVVTYTAALNVVNTGIAQAISNITETSGSVVTLAVAAGSYIASQKVNLLGLTTGTWLNGQTVTLLPGTTPTSLVFNDPTAHGVQASHAETGTAVVNLNGYSFAIGGFVNGGNNGTFTITSNTATTLVVTNAAGVNETHAGTAGSFTVDCPTANFTANATVGQLAFATNLTSGGFTIHSIVVIPQCTIATIVSATQVKLSSAATATTAATSGTICLVWGDDQSTALTNAWNAVTACPNGGMLILPGLNPNGNGPAVMLTQKAQFNFIGSNPGGGASRTGWGLCGGGKNASYIVPTPNFDFSSTVNNVCFLNVPTGGYFHDFTIWGAGNSNPATGLAGKIIAQISSQDNAAMHHVSFIAWGANDVNGIGIGLNVAGGEIIIDEIECDMFGMTGVQCTNAAGDGYVYFGGCGFWDNGSCNMHIAGNGNSPVYTHGCNFGGASYGVSVTGGGIWNDSGSIFGLSNLSGYFIPITLGDFLGVLGSVGTAYLTGTTIDTNTGFAAVYVDNTSCALTLVGCRVKDRGTQICISNNGTVIDGGGNSFFSAGTLYSGTGTLYGALSITGAPQVSGNIALTSGWGTGAAVSAVSGNTRLFKFTVTVGTTPGASPVLTLTFPTKFLVAPICRAGQTGGNNPWQNMIVGAVTTSSVVVTWNGTPVAGDTLIIVVEADLP